MFLFMKNIWMVLRTYALLSRESRNTAEVDIPSKITIMYNTYKESPTWRLASSNCDPTIIALTLMLCWREAVAFTRRLDYYLGWSTETGEYLMYGL